MQFTAPALSVGWLLALIVFILALVLGFMGQLPKEYVLVIAALCAIRL